MTRSRDVAKQGGLVQVIPTSVAVGSGSGSAAANGAVNFTSVSSVSLNGCFNSTYENYMIKFNHSSQTNNGGAIYFRLRGSGSDLATSNYDNKILGIDANANNFSGVFNYHYLGAMASDMGHAEIQVYKPNSPVNSRTITHTSLGYNGNQIYYTGGSRFTTTTAADGFSILPASGTFTGTIRIYGYNNG